MHRSGRTGRAGKDGLTILMHTDSQIRTVRMIERDVGCKFELIGVPSPHDVLRSSSEQAREALSKVHPDLRSIFLPTAEMLLQEQGAHALAAAIAHLSGFTQPPASRSLITHQQVIYLVILGFSFWYWILNSSNCLYLEGMDDSPIHTPSEVGSWRPYNPRKYHGCPCCYLS